LNAANVGRLERGQQLEHRQRHAAEAVATASQALEPGERGKLVEAIGDGRPSVLERLDAVDAGLARLDEEAAEIRNELVALDIGEVDPDELRAVLVKLEPLWAALFPVERTRLLGLLLERVEFDPDTDEVAITFRPGGPQALRGEL
jgi:hypothetical protein